MNQDRDKLSGDSMTKTMALYKVPGDGEYAELFSDEIFTSPAKARKARRITCGYGTDVAIHVGSEHPKLLPFGEKLWREPK